MPEGFHGAYGISERHFIRGAREGMPEPDVDRDCRGTYNRAYRESWRYGDRHPLYGGCQQMEIVRRALSAAGVNPARGSWAANVRSIGEFPVPTLFLGGYTGKSDYAGTVVTIRYDLGCADSPVISDQEAGCYPTLDRPRRARY